MRKVSITAISHHLPDRVVKNAELFEKYRHLSIEKLPDEESIFEKTGILERRYVEKENTTDIVHRAINKLLKSCSLKKDQIDCIVIGTMTPDFFFPSTAVNVINNLRATNAWGFDLSAACSGFCYSVSVVSDMITAGTINNAIVCGAETWSKMLHDNYYKTALLCGDGAGAVLLEVADENSQNVINGKLLKVKADGLEPKNVYYKTPFNSLAWSEERFELVGGEVYRGGVSEMINSIKEYISSKKLNFNQFKAIIPHQANLNMLKDVAKGLKLPIDFFKINIESIGNTGAATIPICLSEFIQKREIVNGDRVLLVSFGAGYTMCVIDVTLDIN